MTTANEKAQIEIRKQSLKMLKVLSESRSQESLKHSLKNFGFPEGRYESWGEAHLGFGMNNIINHMIDLHLEVIELRKTILDLLEAAGSCS